MNKIIFTLFVIILFYICSTVYCRDIENSITIDAKSEYSILLNEEPSLTALKPNKPNLLEPHNDTTLHNDTVTFRWNRAISTNEIWYYGFLLFWKDNLIADVTIMDTTYTLNIYRCDTTFSWSIGVRDNTGWSEFDDRWYFTLDCSTPVFDKIEKNEETKVYPNPANDYIDIFLNYSQQYDDILVYNALGECLLIGNSELSTSFTRRIDISKLSAGVYFVRIANNCLSFVKI